MNEFNEYPYWIALSHLPKWGNEKINWLIIEILHTKKITFDEFFALNEKEMKEEFNLLPNQITDIQKAKSELPNYSFLAENLFEQGFQLIPINSKEYSEILKQNLKRKYSPPLLYVKGNTKLLNEDSIAIVGSRNTSEISLEFTKNIAKNVLKIMK